MLTSVSLFSLLLFGPPAEVQTRFVQTHPPQAEPVLFQRSAGQKRAVVLVHGLAVNFKSAKASEAKLTDWQQSGPLVRALADCADVYAFAYGQTVPVDRIAQLPALRQGVVRLKLLGYEDIVLLGHSAGGIVVRHFVEDNPDLGVTKVIQVCAPNGGSLFAKLNLVAPGQRAFVGSLTEASRKKAAAERAGTLMPKQVQCLCVVGFGAGSGDAVVSSKAQWPEDLQAQGVPVARLKVLHWVVMGCPDCAKDLAGYVCQDHQRWTTDQVAGARMIFGLMKSRRD